MSNSNPVVQTDHHDTDSSPLKNLDIIYNELKEMYKSPSGLEEKMVNESVIFLLGRPPEHWFCSNEQLTFVARTSLLSFSYFQPEPVIIAYREKLKKVLYDCHNCARGYHNQLFKVLDLILNDLQYEESLANEYMDFVASWNVARLSAVLESTKARLKQLAHPKASSIVPDMITLFECLCVPNLLLNPDYQHLFDLFKSVFFMVQRPEHPVIRSSDLTPGYISFLFGNDPELYIFTKISISKMPANNKFVLFKKEDMDDVVLHAFDQVVSNIQSGSHSQYELRLFWYNFNHILQLLDASAIKDSLASREQDIIRFLVNSILLSPSQSLPAALRAFSSVIQKLGTATWEVLYPTKPLPIVNSIIKNEYLQKQEGWLNLPNDNEQNQLLGYPQQSTDVLDWVIPLLKSCDQTDMIKAGTQIIPFLFKNAKLLADKVEGEALYRTTFDTIITCIKIEPRTRVPFVFQVERLIKQDIKVLVYQYGPDIIKACDTFKNLDIQVTRKAQQIIYYSILVDVIAGEPESLSLKKAAAIEGDGENPPPNVKSPWEVLNDVFPLDSEIAIQVLRAIKYVGFIVRPPPKKPNEVPVFPKNKLSEKAVDEAVRSMQTISLFDPKLLDPIISDYESFLSLILSMYSAHSKITESAVDVLCQAFDADNRLSALTRAMDSNLKSTLNVLTESYAIVQDVEIFSPYPKLIKVSQDIIQCLFGATSGVAAKRKHELTPGKENELLTYWVRSWVFLEVAFKKTPKWSYVFKSDFMLEFLRDLLDFSKDLVDYFFLVESLIPPLEKNSDGAKPESISSILLAPVVKCIVQMCEMLRLKDESLILTCFNIIMSVLDLMKNFGVAPSRTLVDIFIGLASSAKAFQNVLTNDQKVRLLVASGNFDLETAESILGRDTSASEDDSSSSKEPQSISTSTTTSIQKPRGQTAINDFARPGSQTLPKQVQDAFSKSVNVIGSAPHKQSMLEAVRQDLKLQTARPPIKPLPIPKEIHPPRPPGFNSSSRFGRQAAVNAKKRDTSKSAGNSSSEDESSDDDKEDGLFTVTKTVTKLRNIEKQRLNASGVGISYARRARDLIAEKERRQRDMRARLQVDLDPLYKHILSWDYHSNSPFPQKLNKNAAPNDAKNYRPVPAQFKSVDEYVKIFEPLLMLECWQGLVKMKEEGNETPFKTIIGSKTLVGNGIYEIRASISSKIAQDIRLGDSDLLLLSYFENSSIDSLPQQPSKSAPYCLAKVKEVKPNGPENFEITLRVDDPPLSMHNHLTTSQVIDAIRVGRLVSFLFFFL